MSLSDLHNNQQGDELKVIEERLEGVRDSMRLPNPQPAKLLDLPMELLHEICEFVRGEVNYPNQPGDVEQIKKLRLTCRALSLASSHLLKYSVKVEMTQQSISRLEEVSKHSDVKRGIRVVKLCLGRHYNLSFALDFRRFRRDRANRILSRLERGIELRTTLLDFDIATQHARDRACHVVESFMCNEESREYTMLKRAHKVYHQCCHIQRRLNFDRAISSAMKLFPRVTWLEITDEINYGEFCPDKDDSEDFYLQYFNREDTNDLDPLQRQLQAPELSWDTELPWPAVPYPLRILPSILASIERAGISLKHLDMRMLMLDGFSSFLYTNLDHPKQKALCRQLKTFSFAPHGDKKVRPETQDILRCLSSTLIDTPSLQKISLDFRFMYSDDDWREPNFSVAPLLVSCDWPNLKELYFNGPFYFKELEKLMNRLSKDVHVQWSGYLMDESWRKVLDFLRSCKLRNFVLGDQSVEFKDETCLWIQGQECHWFGLDGLDRYRNFGRGLCPTCRGFNESQATRFILNRDPAIRNPLEDCV